MNAYDGRVDHLDITFSSLGDCVHDAVPDAGFAPPQEAVVAGRVRAVPLRKIAPWRTRAQYPEDTAQHPPVVDTRHAARIVRKQKVDDRPVEVGQVISSAHVQAPTV